MSLQSFLSTSGKAELKTYPELGPNQPILIMDTPGVVYVWDGASMATPDDDRVLLPDGLLVTDPGRYILTYNLSTKKRDVFAGSTNSSGNYTVTYPVAYATKPHINPVLLNASDTQLIKITSSTNTGFTVSVRNRVDVIGLLPTYQNVNAASVEVLVIEM